MTADTNTDILTRLERETRAEHDAIEQLLDLTSETLTFATYRHRLEQLHRYHQSVEARLYAVPGLDLRARRKTPLLEADLAALEGEHWRPLAGYPALPPLGTPEERFGCLYVLEGATLGGQVISRHLRRVLGVTPETGGRFFYGYGRRTAQMWRAFRAALTAFAETTEAHDEIVAAAVATFRTLRWWCEDDDRGTGRARSHARPSREEWLVV